MTWNQRIDLDPRILGGKPVIRGTRLTVEFILELMGQGWTEQHILAEYPGVTREDLLACLRYASETLKAEKVYPVGTGV